VAESRQKYPRNRAQQPCVGTNECRFSHSHFDGCFLGAGRFVWASGNHKREASIFNFLPWTRQTLPKTQRERDDNSQPGSTATRQFLGCLNPGGRYNRVAFLVILAVVLSAMATVRGAFCRDPVTSAENVPPLPLLQTATAS
jgi:hypothetical protein